MTGETIPFDFDIHGKIDTILLKNLPFIEDPGEFESIKIELSNGQTFKQASKEVWDSVDISATKGLINNLRSDRVICLIQNIQNFIFVFSHSYA